MALIIEDATIYHIATQSFLADGGMVLPPGARNTTGDCDYASSSSMSDQRYACVKDIRDRCVIHLGIDFEIIPAESDLPVLFF